jgi:CubicO group peptidase (beta-lactamase class C family)
MSKFSTHLILLLFLFFIPVTVGEGYALSPAVKDDLGERLDNHLSRLAAFGFSGSVLVARDGKVVLNKGYGLADRKNRIPVSTETVFDIASITKQFTAAAILKLEMEGKLKTTDTIGKFFSKVPDDKSSITLHHLLTHTSGLRAVLDGNEGVSRDQFIEGMLATPLNSKPGEKYAYSNAGFTLLAAIVEIVSNQSYENFLTEQLFKPAGMSNTGFYEDKNKWDASRVARGYDEDRDRGAPTEWNKDFRFRGSSYVLISTGDLYKWEQALKAETILSKAAKQKFFAAHTQADLPGTSYAYGWIVAKTPRGTTEISHDGIGFGFNSVYARYIDEGVTMIVLSNETLGRFHPVGPIEQDLSKIIFNGKSTTLPRSISADQAALQKYAGVYEFASKAKLNVKAVEGGLQISAEGQEGLDLVSGATAEERKKNADLSERGKTVFLGISRGDLEPFVREVKGRIPENEARPAISGLWKRLEDRHGPFKSLEVLGTVTEPEAHMTYFRINFEKGIEYRRIRWEQGNLAYILQTNFPLIPTQFAPASQTEFHGYHLGIARLSQINFDINDRKEVVGLTFRTSGGKVSARKVEVDKSGSAN